MSVINVIKRKLQDNNDAHFTAVFGSRDFGNFIQSFGIFYLKIGKFYTFLQSGKGLVKKVKAKVSHSLVAIGAVGVRVPLCLVFSPKIGQGKSLVLMQCA
ncbi:MAG: hypothetical protein AB2693_33020 [Candidatus Thiodiazotropha sp.]